MIFKVDNEIEQKTQMGRFFSINAKNDFKSALRKQEWLNMYTVQYEDVNEQCKIESQSKKRVFMFKFSGMLNQHFPKRIVNSGYKLNKCQYLNNFEVIKCKNEKEHLAYVV